MTKLRVEFDKKICVGNGVCAAIAPQYFELLGKKAKLLNSKQLSQSNKNSCFIEGHCDENAAKQLIEAARGCPVNAIRVIDKEQNKDIVSNKVDGSNIKEIFAEYDDLKEFVIDNAGYFLIRLDRKNQNIEVAFCNEKNKIILKVTGKKPVDIYHAILSKEKLNIRMEHAAYLGRELQKAYIALKNNLEYIQDDELDINKKTG
ncbi:DUF4346 domain-containing protein [Candidatus Woesearchaeota archaeon]|nr:DUF4346 domain-containing protein [Candidatus Woesearchaeota archaeon]